MLQDEILNDKNCNNEAIDKKKVLIAEDDSFARTFIMELFTSAGYSVIEVSNGKEALDKAASGHDISLIISDINMPEMNGLELIKELNGRGLEIPVIVLTGNDDIAVAIEAMHSGASYYIIKDENIEKTITVAVKEVLEKERIKEKNRRLLVDLSVKNEQLNRTIKELKQAQSHILQREKMASVGQLAAGVAHEINNPIGFIMSNLNTLQKYINNTAEFLNAQSEVIGDLARPAAKDIDIILNSIEEKKQSLKIDYILGDIESLINESIDGTGRVKEIVQNLKSFAHVDEEEYKLADINSGLDSTINIIWNELKYKATLKKEYGDIPMTECNHGELNQVFMNILVNAAQAIEGHGEITIRTWSEKSDILISISDNGRGIPEKVLNRIFEPFFTTKDVGKGTGLGLSIVFDIIKKHNGKIKADSEVGKGTTFTIKIPVINKK